MDRHGIRNKISRGGRKLRHGGSEQLTGQSRAVSHHVLSREQPEPRQQEGGSEQLTNQALSQHQDEYKELRKIKMFLTNRNLAYETAMMELECWLAVKDADTSDERALLLFESAYKNLHHIQQEYVSALWDHGLEEMCANEDAYLVELEAKFLRLELRAKHKVRKTRKGDVPVVSMDGAGGQRRHLPKLNLSEFNGEESFGHKGTLIKVYVGNLLKLSEEGALPVEILRAWHWDPSSKGLMSSEEELQKMMTFLDAEVKSEDSIRLVNENCKLEEQKESNHSDDEDKEDDFYFEEDEQEGLSSSEEDEGPPLIIIPSEEDSSIEGGGEVASLWKDSG